MAEYGVSVKKRGFECGAWWRCETEEEKGRIRDGW